MLSYVYLEVDLQNMCILYVYALKVYSNGKFIIYIRIFCSRESGFLYENFRNTKFENIEFYRLFCDVKVQLLKFTKFGYDRFCVR